MTVKRFHGHLKFIRSGHSFVLGLAVWIVAAYVFALSVVIMCSIVSPLLVLPGLMVIWGLLPFVWCDLDSASVCARWRSLCWYVLMVDGWSDLGRYLLFVGLQASFFVRGWTAIMDCTLSAFRNVWDRLNYCRRILHQCTWHVYWLLIAGLDRGLGFDTALTWAGRSVPVVDDDCYSSWPMLGGVVRDFTLFSSLLIILQISGGRMDRFSVIIFRWVITSRGIWIWAHWTVHGLMCRQCFQIEQLLTHNVDRWLCLAWSCKAGRCIWPWS